MATNFTAADLATLDNAIVQGVKEVWFSDGRKVAFSTFGELVARRNFIATQLEEAAGRTRAYGELKKGLSI